MPIKKFNPEQMQRCLEVLDALVQSGLSTQEFAQAQGLSYGQLRGWLSHGPRWRSQLADPAYIAPARRRPGNGKETGFVQVNVGDRQPPSANTHPAAQTKAWPDVRIDCSQGARSVVLHWPAGAPLQCAQWLKAYLA